MVDGAADAQQIVADDIHIDITSYIESVAAAVADQHSSPLITGAEHIEIVIPLHSIQSDLLDVLVTDVQASAIHTILGDHEVIMEFGADYHNSIFTISTIDADRCIDDIIDLVIALTAVDIGHGLLGKFIKDDEGPYDEGVVIVVAFQPEHCQIVIHLEDILTIAAHGRQRIADTVA